MLAHVEQLHHEFLLGRPDVVDFRSCPAGKVGKRVQLGNGSSLGCDLYCIALPSGNHEQVLNEVRLGEMNSGVEFEHGFLGHHYLVF